MHFSTHIIIIIIYRSIYMRTDTLIIIVTVNDECDAMTVGKFIKIQRKQQIEMNISLFIFMMWIQLPMWMILQIAVYCLINYIYYVDLFFKRQMSNGQLKFNRLTKFFVWNSIVHWFKIEINPMTGTTTSVN